ncbi:tubulinyl-Tyr carboxypeptidase 1-like [Hydractinia symbiolongicarpus]|uniref:tubulinyl-Tyr carboxypeptidase 1-like n=1 Tax=Hydractinia symbiolongicarpus TaxID=13093 RepID=UPI00254B744F|nr:tubulinyl-Tyr carboxypeptidase 1-like [Hydractinia symbiolongicarpus]
MENDTSNTVFPLNELKWQAMLDQIKDCHPDGESIIANTTNLINENKEGEFPIPKQPVFTSLQSVSEKVKMVQRYLNQLQYNHTGTQFFEVKMNRPITRLYETAKDIIKYSLPIKCLEAVIVSLYLTSCMNGLTRFTIRFKSKFSSKTHRHIVLGIYYDSKYGALGLSRRKTLMYKPLKYKSLYELIVDFKDSYRDCYHELRKVKISPSISNDLHSCDHIMWNFFVVPVGKLDKEEIKSVLEKYSRELRVRAM